MHTRTITAVFFVLILSLPYLGMLGGRAGDAPVEESGARTLNIVSPHRREVRMEYSRGFAAWMRDRHGYSANVRWLDVGGASKVLKDLESRFQSSPDNPGVDIMFGGGVTPYVTGIQNGWLEKIELPAPVLAGIPATCAGSATYDADGRWFGVALSGFGIIYNRAVVERLGLTPPAGWEDLAGPDYFTWVGSGDPRSSGSVFKCYDIVLQAYGFDAGWGILARICANVRSFGEGGGVVPREVASGEIAAGMVIDQYAQTVIDAVGDNVLVFVLPRKATIINPDAIGVFKGAAEPELARLFVEYALSDEGQRLLFQPEGVNGQKHSLFRMPVRASLYDDVNAPRSNPYAFSEGLVYDEAKSGRWMRALNDLMGVWLIDAHPELKAAWKSVIDGGCEPARVAGLCRAPVTEAQLLAFADAWDDQRTRQETKDRWAAEARAHYRAIADGGTGR